MLSEIRGWYDNNNFLQRVGSTLISYSSSLHAFLPPIDLDWKKIIVRYNSHIRLFSQMFAHKKILLNMPLYVFKLFL